MTKARRCFVIVTKSVSAAWQEKEGVDQHDGRIRYEWRTKYPSNVQKEIFTEGICLCCILGLSLTMLLVAWFCFATNQWNVDRYLILKTFVYYAASGTLGGTVFGMKYFYRVVAHGFWHQDRRYWRIMSPIIATVIAVIVGTLIQASYLHVERSLSSAANISIGFMAGYFADEAVGKMHDIASVIFGASKSLRDDPGSSSNAR